MKIRTEYDPKPVPTSQFDWSAWDEDSYDGAPDAGPRARLVGYGPTQDAAIADLLEQMEGYE